MTKNIFKYIIVTGVLLIAYANCARFVNTNSENEDEAVLSSTCSDCDVAPVYLKPTKSIDSLDGENLNIRQFSESIFSLLGQKVEKLSPIYVDILTTEKELRRPLLPQINQASTVNSMGILSQASLAGQACRVSIYNHVDASAGGEAGIDVPFFEKVNWNLSPDKIANTAEESKQIWLSAFEKMALKMWGRNLKSVEKQAVIDFITVAVSESLAPNPLAVSTEIGGKNLQTLNIAIMLCTAALVSPESGLL